METIYRLGLRFIGRIYVPERDSDFHVTTIAPRSSPTADSLRVKHQLSPKGGSPVHSPTAQYLKEKRLKRRQSSMFSLPGDDELGTPLGSSSAHRLSYSASYGGSTEDWAGLGLQLTAGSGAVSSLGLGRGDNVMVTSDGKSAARTERASIQGSEAKGDTF